MTIKNRQQRGVKQLRRAIRGESEIVDLLSPIEKIRRRTRLEVIDGDYK